MGRKKPSEASQTGATGAGSTPTVARARAYVLETMAAAGAGGRLPPLSALARTSGFGRVSVWRAVRDLVAEGKLEAAPGRGIRLPGGAAAPPAVAPGTPMWQKTRDRLLADAQAGTYGRGVKLPIVKELASRYGTSARIVRQALWALERAGVLGRERHGFRVATLERGTSEGRVAIVAVTRTVDVLLKQSPRAPEFWRALEHGIRRLGTTPHIVAYHSAVGAQRFPYFPYRDILAFDRARMVLGYVVLAFGLEPEWLAQVLGLLRQTGKPVSVMDELGIVPQDAVSAALGAEGRMRLFRIGTTESAGDAVGRYLLALGHRRVACVSTMPEAAWSRSRVAGLAAAYRAAGLEGAVSEFGLPPGDTSMSLRSAPPGLLKPVLDEFAKLEERLHDARDRMSSDELRSLLAAEYQRSRLTAVYDRVRAEARDATAWVGTNDAAVLPALPYLHARKLTVPRDVSLVGMDNTVEACGDGLTSYDFSMPGVAEAMLAHVAGWSATRRRREPTVVEIPGVVVERTSSGPPGTSRSRV